MDNNTNNSAGNPPVLPTSTPSTSPIEPAQNLSANIDITTPIASPVVQATPSVPPVAVQPPASSLPPKKKSMVWVIILLLIAFICGLALAGWYFQAQLQKVFFEKPTAQLPVEQPKTLIIGTDPTFQPMEYVATDGALMGYDIDLGKGIAEELKTKVEFKKIPWNNLFKALDNKQVDIIMSSVTITDERKQKYDFSDNYLNAGQVIITQKNNMYINSADTLKGKRIAVQQGTTNEIEALKFTSPELVIRYPDFVQATQALVNGQVDAILSDLPGAKGIIAANVTLKIASDPLTNEYYGIVLRKNDPSLEKINQALSAIRTKGILTDLKQKWLD